MLGKLLKYEWKATSRVLLPLYAIFLVTALLTNLFFTGGDSIFSGIILMTFVGASVACMVMTLVLLIQRFKINLLQDEGYLMFTLPVSIPHLIFSKMLIALLWGILGGLIGMLGGIFIFLNSDFILAIREALSQIQVLLQAVTWEHILFILLVLVTSILAYSSFIMAISASLSVSQLPVLSKWRRLAGIGCFVLLYVVFINISSFFQDKVFGNINAFTDVASLFPTLIASVAMEAAFFTGLFLLTHYILKNRLNLE